MIVSLIALAALHAHPALHAASRSQHRKALEKVAHDWSGVAACESSGRWHINSSNGYYGGLQMDLTFWDRYGGSTFASRPDLASEAQQIVVAERGLEVQGAGAWPWCGRYLRDAA